MKSFREIVEYLNESKPSYTGDAKEIAEFLYEEHGVYWRGTWKNGDMSLDQMNIGDAFDVKIGLVDKFPKLSGHVRMVADKRNDMYRYIYIDKKIIKNKKYL